MRTPQAESDAEFIRSMQAYKLDHAPDGWPAVQQWQIDRLLEMFSCLATKLLACKEGHEDCNECIYYTDERDAHLHGCILFPYKPTLANYKRCDKFYPNPNILDVLREQIEKARQLYHYWMERALKAEGIVERYPNLDEREVEVECSNDAENVNELMKRCPIEGNKGCVMDRRDTGMKQCSGTITIPLLQALQEGREGRLVKK